MKRKKTIVLLIFLMLSVIGCSTAKRVFVLHKEELIRVRAGQNITAEYDGWLLSDRAVDRVMDARIEGVRLK